MILDTCALLWLASGEKRLSRQALKQITEAPELCVSVITGFEIALKTSRGKFRLPKPAKEWFVEIVRYHGITVLPIDLEVGIGAAQLPLFHNDPCDRVIIATAKHYNFPIVTTDENFSQYDVKIIS